MSTMVQRGPGGTLLGSNLPPANPRSHLESTKLSKNERKTNLKKGDPEISQNEPDKLLKNKRKCSKTNLKRT